MIIFHHYLVVKVLMISISILGFLFANILWVGSAIL